MAQIFASELKVGDTIVSVVGPEYDLVVERVTLDSYRELNGNRFDSVGVFCKLTNRTTTWIVYKLTDRLEVSR